jgi:hypothetical protein
VETIRTSDFDEFVVNSKEQKGRNPLTDESALFLFACELQVSRKSNGPDRRPEEDIRRKFGRLFLNCPRRDSFRLLRGFSCVCCVVFGVASCCAYHYFFSF